MLFAASASTTRWNPSVGGRVFVRRSHSNQQLKFIQV